MVANPHRHPLEPAAFLEYLDHFPFSLLKYFDPEAKRWKIINRGD